MRHGMMIKISILVSLILTGAMAMNFCLSVLSYDKTYRRLMRNQIGAIGQHVKRQVDYGLRLGLDLNSIHGLEQSLVDARKQYPNLGVAVICDTDCAVLAHADDGNFVLPREQLKSVLEKQDDRNAYDVDLPEHFGLTYVLKNDFGETEGLLLLLCAETTVRPVIDRAADYAAGTAGLVTVVVVLLASLAVVLIFRPLQHMSLWLKAGLDSLTEKQQPIMEPPYESIPLREDFQQYQRRTVGYLEQARKMDEEMREPSA